MKAFNEKVILRNVAIDPQGGAKDLLAAINTPVTVFLTGTQTLASLFDLNEDAIANPVNTDIKGNVVFKVADGIYDIVGASGTQNETRWDQVEIIDLSVPLDVKNIKHFTLAEAVANATALEGQVVQITDRADGQFEYKTGQTPNTFNIVAADAAGLDLALRINSAVNTKEFGTSIEAAQAAIDEAISISATNLNLNGLVLTGGLTVDGASNLIINGQGVDITSDAIDKIPFLVINGTKLNINGITGSQPLGGNGLLTAAVIVVRDSTKIYTRSCDVDATDFNGLIYVNVNKGKISDCESTSSTVDPVTIVTNNTSTGIGLIDGCKKCKVTHNTVDKAGLGINVQAITALKDLNDNSVIDNDVTDCYGYGINVYSLASLVKNTVIANNRVADITGQISNLAVGGAKTHGSGIYLQDAKGTTVTGNIVERTNINTDSATLVPASIAMNGGEGNVITGNNVSDSIGFWGIGIVNSPLVGKASSVTGNVVNGFAIGINILDSNNVTVSGNGSTENSKGFVSGVSQTTENVNLTISGNNFSNNLDVGMDMADTDSSSISGNTVSDNGSHGINFLSCEDLSFSSNACNNNGGIGFRDNGGNVYSAHGTIGFGNTGGGAQVASPRARTDFTPELTALTVGSFAPVRTGTIDGAGELDVNNARLITVTSAANNLIKLIGANTGERVIVKFEVATTVIQGTIKLAGGVSQAVTSGDVFEFIIRSGSEQLEVSRVI